MNKLPTIAVPRCMSPWKADMVGADLVDYSKLCAQMPQQIWPKAMDVIFYEVENQFVRPLAAYLFYKRFWQVLQLYEQEHATHRLPAVEVKPAPVIVESTPPRRARLGAWLIAKIAKWCAVEKPQPMAAVS